MCVTKININISNTQSQMKIVKKTNNKIQIMIIRKQCDERMGERCDMSSHKAAHPHSQMQMMHFFAFAQYAFAQIFATNCRNFYFHNFYMFL